MKCALHNLGCKVNSYETDAMQQLLEKAGYTIVEFGVEPADIYIINTCTVTNMADRKSRQMLHKAKKDNPDSIVVAAGCYAQEAGEKLLEDESIDIVIGNNKKKDIVEILDEYLSTHKVSESIIDINHTNEYECLEIDQTSTHTRAYIKIQDGCNQFCTYCAIPFARGRVRSRRKDDILNEVNKLAKSGCHEVVLTGIHLSSYGLDFDNVEYNETAGNGVDKPVMNSEHLLEVIEAIADIEGIERIRLGSLEPRIITEEFAGRLAKLNKICPHFHLSLQSGCDATLKRMNRRYNCEEFYRGVCILRNAFDHPAVTTDVIVGFPGETDEEFETTRAYLEKVNFFEMHVFKYSRRKGTMADKMKNQIPDPIKSVRSDALIRLDEQLSEEYRRSFIDQTEEVLIEEFVEQDNIRYAVGHTKRYVKVLIKTNNEPTNIVENTIVKVKILDTYGNAAVVAELI